MSRRTWKKFVYRLPVIGPLVVNWQLQRKLRRYR